MLNSTTSEVEVGVTGVTSLLGNVSALSKASKSLAEDLDEDVRHVSFTSFLHFVGSIVFH